MADYGDKRAKIDGSDPGAIPGGSTIATAGSLGRDAGPIQDRRTLKGAAFARVVPIQAIAIVANDNFAQEVRLAA